jgi:hypothetical protein
VIAPGGNPVMTFSQPLANPTGSHTLNFIIADRADTQLDSTAYIGSLGGQNPGPRPAQEPPYQSRQRCCWWELASSPPPAGDSAVRKAS